MNKDTASVKVSIIMPTYNRSYTIQRAIESVLRQTVTEWELIIVNDGSTDDTVEKVNNFSDDRISIISYGENKGANYARNLGISKAKGKYIAFLDSDNEWHNDYLEKQLVCFENTEKAADLVFARSCVHIGEIEYIFPEATSEELSNNEEIIRASMYWSVFDTNVVCMKRELWNPLQKFNEQMLRFQDWEFFLRLLSTEKYSFYFNDQVLCEDYIQKDSIGSKDNLFWDARLYIFQQYIKKCRSLKILQEVFIQMMTDAAVEYILPEHIDRLLSLLTNDEKEKFYKNYIIEQNKVRSLIKKYNEIMEKNNKILSIQKKWIHLQQQGGGVTAYFLENNMRKIGIYGFGILGELLYDELRDSNIQIEMIIDAEKKSEDIPIYKLEEVREFPVDVIVVTAAAAFEKIKEILKVKTDVKVISLEEIFQ